jgi:hypothetical protein
MKLADPKSLNNQDYADGNVECRGIDASEEAIGVDINVVCWNAPRASPDVAQVAIHLQVAFQGTGVCNVYNTDMAKF